MIPIKSQAEIECMRRAGHIAGSALQTAANMVRPGVTTAEIDRAVNQFIIANGALPSFLGYDGYTASACISVNNEVIHGVPGKRRLKEGDIVAVDVGAYYDGFHGDTAATFPVGGISSEARRLIDVTRECFYAGLSFAREGCRVSDVSGAIEKLAVENGYSVVRDYTGHGVGRALHEEPSVPNYLTTQRGARLFRGMTLAIEPMINAGGHEIKIMKDKWTVVTADGSLSAHYEHTVLITEGEPELLTLLH